MKRFSINVIAMANLRQHKKQYAALTAGIILAIFFSSAALLFGWSIIASTDEIYDYRLGLQDAIISNVKDAPLDELVQRGLADRYGTASILGCLSADEESSGVSAAVFDETAKQLANWEILEGALPVHQGEIALEQSALRTLNNKAKVGDKITLVLRVPSGSTAENDDPVNGEGFLKPVKKTYTLTGILSDHVLYLKDIGVRTTVYQDLPAAVFSGQEQIETGGKPVVNAYLDLSKTYFKNHSNASESPEKNTYYALRDFFARYTGNDLIIETWHHENLWTMGTENIFYIARSLLSVGIVLVLASCLGIINAFHANLQARKKQIGMLRAVAATRSQIRKIFGREAILLACMSIPFAIILACLLVSGLTRLMGAGYHLVLNPWILLSTAVLSLLVIVLAAGVPLVRASRIPPMQAIRDVTLSRRMGAARLRRKKQFRVPQYLAKRSLLLYRGSRLSLTALIAASLLVFAVFIQNIRLPDRYPNDMPDYGIYNYEMLNGEIGTYNVIYQFNAPGLNEADRSRLAGLPLVETVKGSKVARVRVFPERITDYLMLDGAECAPEYLLTDTRLLDPLVKKELLPTLERTQKDYQEYKHRNGYQKDFYTADCNAYEDSELLALKNEVVEGEINLDKLASGEEVLVYASPYYCVQPPDEYSQSNRISQYSEDLFLKKRSQYAEENIFANDMFHAGDELTLNMAYYNCALTDPEARKEPKQVEKTVRIGAVLNGGQHEIVTSLRGISALGFGQSYAGFELYLSAEPDEAMAEYLDSELESMTAPFAGVSIVDRREQAEEQHQNQIACLVSNLSVIILIFASCVSIVTGAVSARIRAGQQSIGMLRAVGASERDIYRSYFCQLRSLFVRGALISIPIYILLRLLLAYLDWMKWHESSFAAYLIEYFGLPAWQPLVFDVVQPLIFAAVLFGVCCCVIRRRLCQVTGGSIVENIREL